MGMSFTFRSPVAPFSWTRWAIRRSWPLVAFVLVVPLGILGGVFAALHVGRPLDRIISIVGLSATVVPEFVSGIVLILIFGVWLRWLPITAAWPEGSGPLTQIYYLILPSLPLVLVLFGYIARMARAGTVEALDADYTRTAVLKGLPRRTVIWRHVLRNALLPTITVIATQVGYLIGGLVVVEMLFHYQGIGSLIFTAARGKDFPMLEAGVLTIGIIYTIATLSPDFALFPAESAHPLRICAMSATAGEAAGARSAASPRARADARRCCAPAPSWPASSSWASGSSARSSAVIWCRYDPYADDLLNSLGAPSAEHWFGTDQLGPRHLLAGHRRLARHPHRGAAWRPSSAPFSARPWGW